jgi:hypothetical protein
MEIRALRYFVEVVRQQSFTGRARLFGTASLDVVDRRFVEVSEVPVGIVVVVWPLRTQGRVASAWSVERFGAGGGRAVPMGERRACKCSESDHVSKPMLAVTVT